MMTGEWPDQAEILRRTTSYDFMKDAEAAVEYLLKVDRIDRSKIGIIGHSEGGLIAPLLATERDDLAFIILLAGPEQVANRYCSIKMNIYHVKVVFLMPQLNRILI